MADKKNFLRKIASIFFRKEHSLRSALNKILGKKRMQQTMLRNTDWRNIVEEAAFMFPELAADIHADIAEYFAVPFIPRVPAIDLEALPKEISFDDLRRLACIPRINNNIVTSFICLDPQRAGLLFPYKKQLPFGIASWKSIETALDESASLLKSKQDEESEKESLQFLEAAKQALHLVILQAKNYSARSFDISFIESDKIFYNFETNDGKSARGNINSRVRSVLSRLLGAYSEEERVCLEFPGIAKHDIRVSFDNDKQVFSVSMLEEYQTTKDSVSGANVISFPEASPFKACTRAESKPFKEPHNLLIVDDNQVFAKVLERFLEKLNVKAQYAADGSEALKLLREETYKPDMVICDLHMPQMNGCEFTKRVREELRMEDLPIIILTSDDDVETELQLLTEGADVFIAKSEDPRLLCIKVQKLIEKADKKKAA